MTIAHYSLCFKKLLCLTWYDLLCQILEISGITFRNHFEQKHIFDHYKKQNVVVKDRNL